MLYARGLYNIQLQLVLFVINFDLKSKKNKLCLRGTFLVANKGGVWYAVHRYYVYAPVHCIPNIFLGFCGHF